MVNFCAAKKVTVAITRNYSYATVPDPTHNLLCFLQLSIDHQSLKTTQTSHTQVISNGFSQNPFIATKLITAYASCGHPTQSRRVFDSVFDKNVYLWNSTINGYVKNRLFNEALSLFNEMLRSVRIDDFTLTSMSKLTGEIGGLRLCECVHGKSLRIGFDSDVVVSNSLMAMYCKCDQFGEARKLFDEMPQRNVGSWNVIISAYVGSGDCNFDWGLVRNMRREGLKPDAFTVSSLLPLCTSHSGKWDYGKELHCFIVRNEFDSGFGSDVHMGCCLIDMYTRGGRVVEARRVFDRLERRNVYTWTAIINGYVKNGEFYESLVLFREMQVRDRIKPNEVSLVSILPACSSLAGLMGGKQIHAFAIRRDSSYDLSLTNALIDMYCKNGSLNNARQVFENISVRKDAITWSSMICGYGCHGMAKEAIFLYNKMLQLGNKPDTITVVGVLSACVRSELLNEGLDMYNSAINEHGIKPTVEMCSCVVDMLGRSGQLDKALDFINKMPVDPGPSVWGALVSASVRHGDFKMREHAYKFLIQLEPENPANYVSVSNLHASSRKWDVVAKVRSMMKEKGLKKTPGCSWICVNGKTHSFCVADMAHPSKTSIYNMVDDLVLMMKETELSSPLENMTSLY
ncbi:hypothetical protein ACFE04_008858 [Oxalis oulophora]